MDGKSPPSEYDRMSHEAKTVRSETEYLQALEEGEEEQIEE